MIHLRPLARILKATIGRYMTPSASLHWTYFRALKQSFRLSAILARLGARPALASVCVSPSLLPSSYRGWYGDFQIVPARLGARSTTPGAQHKRAAATAAQKRRPGRKRWPQHRCWQWQCQCRRVRRRERRQRREFWALDSCFDASRIDDGNFLLARICTRHGHTPHRSPNKRPLCGLVSVRTMPLCSPTHKPSLPQTGARWAPHGTPFASGLSSGARS